MIIKSNAKINLNLKVCGKIGLLHEIESIIVPISLYDSITIEENDEDIILGMNIPYKDNIMYKALTIFKEKFGIEDCYKITINKTIPVQAGLGGGSSNAAFVLKTLGEIYNIDNKELIKLSSEIGSDVTFFMYNKPSLVRGSGNIITTYENFSKQYGVLVFDNDMFSAKEMYTRYDLLENTDKNDADNIHFNDLERSLTPVEKEKIDSIKKSLMANGALYSLMSGSGGTVFGIFNSRHDAKKCEENLMDNYNKVVAFETI